MEFQTISIMTPAEKHYGAIKRAVKKYQDANRDICRERCRNWAKNLKNDPERYQKYLNEKNEYMKKYRIKKSQVSIEFGQNVGSKGHNQENKTAIPITSSANKGENGPHQTHIST